MPLYTEMVAPAAARVGLNRSDLCRDNRSCSNVSVPGSAVTKRASGVSIGIFVHQDYRAILPQNFHLKWPVIVGNSIRLVSAVESGDALG